MFEVGDATFGVAIVGSELNGGGGGGGGTGIFAACTCGYINDNKSLNASH